MGRNDFTPINRRVGRCSSVPLGVEASESNDRCQEYVRAEEKSFPLFPWRQQLRSLELKVTSPGVRWQISFVPEIQQDCGIYSEWQFAGSGWYQMPSRALAILKAGSREKPAAGSLNISNDHNHWLESAGSSVSPLYLESLAFIRNLIRNSNSTGPRHFSN